MGCSLQHGRWGSWGACAEAERQTRPGGQSLLADDVRGNLRVLSLTPCESSQPFKLTVPRLSGGVTVL